MLTPAMLAKLKEKADRVLVSCSIKLGDNGVYDLTATQEINLFTPCKLLASFSHCLSVEHILWQMILMPCFAQCTLVYQRDFCYNKNSNWDESCEVCVCFK